MRYIDYKKMLNKYIERGYIPLDPRDKNYIILSKSDGYNYSVRIDDAAHELFTHKESFEDFKAAIDDAVINHMTLTDFLNCFEFDYTIVTVDDHDYDHDKYIKLIDLTKANLGDIENDLFLISNEGVMGIIERLEIYIQDYIFQELSERLKEEYNCSIDENNWNKLIKTANELHMHYAYEELIPYIYYEKELKLDVLNKMILNDIEFSYSITDIDENLDHLEDNSDELSL